MGRFGFIWQQINLGKPITFTGPWHRKVQGETPGNGTETRPPLRKENDAVNPSGNRRDLQRILEEWMKRPSLGLGSNRIYESREEIRVDP